MDAPSSLQNAMRLLTAVVSLALVASGVVVVLVGSEGSSSPRPSNRADASRASYRGSEVPAGHSLPRFRLRNYTGELFRSDSLRGKVAIVTFLESRCTEACPVIAAHLAQGLALLTANERSRVRALALSTHPGDDTPRSVRAFVRRHGLVGRLDYLIGAEDELRPVWREFRILSALESGDADTHSAGVRIFDRQGEWVTTLHPGVDLSPQNLVHDVREALG